MPAAPKVVLTEKAAAKRARDYAARKVKRAVNSAARAAYKAERRATALPQKNLRRVQRRSGDLHVTAPADGSIAVVEPGELAGVPSVAPVQADLHARITAWFALLGDVLAS